MRSRVNSAVCPFRGMSSRRIVPILATDVAIDTHRDPLVPPPPALPTDRPLLGSILLERGLLAPDRLAEALAEGQATHRRLGDVLLSHAWIYEQELARALAYQYGLEYVDLHTACRNPRDAALLDPEVGRRCRALPMCFSGDELVVAVADPAPTIVEELRARLPYALRLVVTEPSLVQSAWDDLLAGR
jgi:Type II secretion system (T2SS), protein E, N-terminal domain